MSKLPRFLECHKEYSYLGPGGAKNKVEWVSKTMLIRKPLSLNILTPRCKTSIVSLNILLTYINDNSIILKQYNNQ